MDLLKIATDGYLGTTRGFTLSVGTAGYLHVEVVVESDGSRTIIPTLSDKRKARHENALLEDDDIIILTVLAFVENEFTRLF